VRWTTIYKGRKLRQPPDPMPAHRAVFAAIADADPAAAQAAMAALVTEALSHTAEALGAPAPLSLRP
jgi:DNA-binding FadR family transcriptional regulator